MLQLPSLEYNLSHPHPKGDLFLLATIAVFLPLLPIVIIINLATLGSELVPSLQPQFQPNDKLLEGWWGHNLPPIFRPRPPRCEPKDLGRGDKFRLSASLFDYTVMSSWNTTQGASTSGVQKQERIEYRGQSFTDCFVNNTRFKFSLVDQSQTVTVGVVCPGTLDYTRFIAMETEVVFSWLLDSDFLGQYYGSGLDALNIPDADLSDYRRVVLAMLDLIATDSLTIMRGGQLSRPRLLSTSTFIHVNPDSGSLNSSSSAVTYTDGTAADNPGRSDIYGLTIFNLVSVINDAVNLDLGSNMYQNIFRNSSMLKFAIVPNPAPPGIDPGNWAASKDAESLYYGQITPPYQTWAEMLLNGKPFQLSNVTESLPNESVMVTTYLCPKYQSKPLGSLLAAVFVGSATMILSAWGAWMLFTAYLAKKMVPPRLLCDCELCKEKQEKDRGIERSVMTARDAATGMLPRLTAIVGRTRLGNRVPSDEESKSLW